MPVDCLTQKQYNKRLDKCSGGDIPVGVLKQCDFCFQTLTNCVNQSIVRGKFPDSSKLANVFPVCKAKNPLDKTN